MLKQRFISACIMLTVFLTVLFLVPLNAFFIAVFMVFCWAALEWADLSGVTALWQKCIYSGFIFGLTCGAIFGLGALDNPLVLKNIFITACVWWGIALLWVQGYPSSSVLWGSRYVRLLMGVFVLVPAILSLLYLRQQASGALLILFVALLIAAADIGAYFFGRAYGKRKLAPTVSPGKSWEGVLGGAAFAIVFASVFNVFMARDDWLSLYIVVIPAVFVSVLGDLLESMVKRHRGVKDSGRILPGHGGVLDRLDGLVAALPFFTVSLMMTTWAL